MTQQYHLPVTGSEDLVIKTRFPVMNLDVPAPSFLRMLDSFIPFRLRKLYLRIGVRGVPGATYSL